MPTRATKLSSRAPRTPIKSVRYATPPLTSELETPVLNIPSLATLNTWTFTPDAVAPCFIRDALEMRECEDIQYDFFWLGRVPCRTIQVTGLVVGVVTYETRTVFTIDDGTGVLDCGIRRPKPPKPLKVPGKDKAAPIPPKDESPPLIIPRVGQSVKVKGRVNEIPSGRTLNVDNSSIQICSIDDEARHWLDVVRIHRINYDLSEPFTISPPSGATATLPPQTDDITLSSQPDPIPSSSPKSEATTMVDSSPSKSIVSEHFEPCPTRLRHPSRLRTDSLTSNTFRIYIKHYMDHAPPPAIAPRPIRPLSPLNLDELEEPSTPTKRRYQKRSIDLEATPKVTQLNSLRSTRPGRAEGMFGFTLSYLRRVPDLADLAQRVVNAERKRRERQARKEAKEGISQIPASRAVEKVSKKTKRLFIKAIQDLYNEGSIIIWDGPVRSLSDLSDEDLDTSHLWKTSTSSAMFTMTTEPSIAPNTAEDDLSDADEGEDAYVPVTTDLVSLLVQDALKALTKRFKAPPNAQGILKHVRAKDSRWDKVGEWMVEEALEALFREEKVTKAPGSRWRLCL